jgi:spore maturation protein CgeB
MKILYITFTRPNGDNLFSTISFDNMISELKQLSYSFEFLFYDDYKRPDLNKFLIDYDYADYDLVMTDLNDNHLDINVVLSITAITNTLLLCPDNLKVPYRHKKISKHFDLVWLFDYANQDKFISHGAKIIHMPWAFNQFTKPQFNLKFEKRIVFVGSMNQSRIKEINFILSAGYPVDVYGSMENSSRTKFKHIFRFLDSKTLIGDVFLNKYGFKMYLSAFLSLFLKEETLDSKNKLIRINGFTENLTQIYYNYRLALVVETLSKTSILRYPEKIVNLRPFEIIGSGGIILVKKPSLIKNYINNSILLEYDKSNITQIIDKYLYSYNDREIHEIKMSNYRYSQISHSWQARFDRIKKYLRS